MPRAPRTRPTARDYRRTPRATSMRATAHASTAASCRRCSTRSARCRSTSMPTARSVSMNWMRAPKHAPEVIAEIERTVLAASPFPAASRIGKRDLDRHLAVGQGRPFPARHADRRPAEPGRRLRVRRPAVGGVAPRAHQQRHVVVLVGVGHAEIQRHPVQEIRLGQLHALGLEITRHVEHQPVGADLQRAVVVERAVAAAVRVQREAPAPASPARPRW